MREHKDVIEEWNNIHCSLVTQRNNYMADHCEQQITLAKNHYYAGAPIMSDVSYDWYEDKLKTLRPESVMLKKVGSIPIPGGMPLPG